MRFIIAGLAGDFIEGKPFFIMDIHSSMKILRSCRFKNLSEPCVYYMWMRKVAEGKSWQSVGLKEILMIFPWIFGGFRGPFVESAEHDPALAAQLIYSSGLRSIQSVCTFSDLWDLSACRSKVRMKEFGWTQAGSKSGPRRDWQDFHRPDGLCSPR